jgi:hypothetical protein
MSAAPRCTATPLVVTNAPSEEEDSPSHRSELLKKTTARPEDGNAPPKFGTENRKTVRLLRIQFVSMQPNRDGDLDTWRLSRLMREADTDAQVNVAQRKYDVWQQTLAP